MHPFLRERSGVSTGGFVASISSSSCGSTLISRCSISCSSDEISSLRSSSSTSDLRLLTSWKGVKLGTSPFFREHFGASTGGSIASSWFRLHFHGFESWSEQFHLLFRSKNSMNFCRRFLFILSIGFIFALSVIVFAPLEKYLKVYH